MKKNNKGFSLVALLISVLILALLSLVLVRTLNSATTTKTGAPSSGSTAIVDQVQDVVDQANQRTDAVAGQ